MERDPFISPYAWRVPYRLNVSLMRKEAKVLLGKHDFKAFQAKDKKERTSVRTMKKISVSRAGDMIKISLEDIRQENERLKEINTDKKYSTAGHGHTNMPALAAEKKDGKKDKEQMLVEQLNDDPYVGESLLLLEDLAS